MVSTLVSIANVGIKVLFLLTRAFCWHYMLIISIFLFFAHLWKSNLLYLLACASGYNTSVFLSPLEDCTSALVSANLADHWLIHLFMGEENEMPNFFNWIGELALHFPCRKWRWGWCFRLNWKEGRLMLGNKRKWSSKFGLVFICVRYLFGFSEVVLSIQIEWFCPEIERLFHTWAWWIQKGEKRILFSKSVFPNGKVLLIPVKWMSHLTWCDRSHILQWYWLCTCSAFHKVREKVLHLLLIFVASNGRILIVITEHKQLISKLIRFCDHFPNLWKSWY